MHRKIKILFTIPNFTTAGSGREMMNIIDRLDKDLYEPFICVETEGGNLFDEAKEKGYKLLVHRFTVHEGKGIVSIISMAREQASYFKPFHFDLWQSFNWSSDYSEALIAKFSDAKYVYVKKNMNWERKAWKVKSFLANHIVARNSTMWFRMFFPPYLRRKTTFIPGGVDVTRFNKREDKRFRLQYNIPHEICLISCVAQLVRSKDQATLIKAIAEMKDTHLILAGAARDEEYATELKTLVKELSLNDRVTLAGAIQDVNGLLNASDMFVLPTSSFGGHEEGSPVSLLEAIAAEVPCIASNVAGNRDIIHTNKTGLLFVQGNVEELKACILKYRDDKQFAAEIVKNAKEHLLSEYTVEKEAESFDIMYKKMMKIK